MVVSGCTRFSSDFERVASGSTGLELDFDTVGLSVTTDDGWWCFIGFHRVLPGFTGFYRVLPGLTGFYRVISGFYRVLPGFTGFYWILMGFTRFYRVLLGFTGFLRFLLGFTGLYRVLLGFTGLYRVFIGFYRVLPGFTGFYRVLPVFTEFYRVLPGFTEYDWVLPGFTGFYRVFLGPVSRLIYERECGSFSRARDPLTCFLFSSFVLFFFLLLQIKIFIRFPFSTVGSFSLFHLVSYFIYIFIFVSIFGGFSLFVCLIAVVVVLVFVRSFPFFSFFFGCFFLWNLVGRGWMERSVPPISVWPTSTRVSHFVPIFIQFVPFSRRFSGFFMSSLLINGFLPSFTVVYWVFLGFQCWIRSNRFIIQTESSDYCFQCVSAFF